jgi:hypothetical protein
MWALIGFGTVAYPSLGAVIASFLMRASNRRLPGFVVALSGMAWPVTLGLGVAAFPLWLIAWFMKNYGSAIQAFLSKNGTSAAAVIESFNMGDAVALMRSFASLNSGITGRITDQKGTEVQVNFPAYGTFWVPQDAVRRA